MFPRHRARTVTLTAICMMLVATTVSCARAIDGQGQITVATSSKFPSQLSRSAAPSPTVSLPTSSLPTGSLPTSSLPTSSVAPPPTPSSTATQRPVNLVSLLAPRPAGARGWSGAWGNNRRPTVRQYVQHYYQPSSRASVTAVLHAQGLADIAHQTWVARDASQLELILMRFETGGGALSRYSGVTAGMAARSGVTEFSLGGYSRGEVIGYREAGQDGAGYVRARAYGRLTGSTILAEAFFFSPGGFAKSDLTRWMNDQLRLLP